MQYSTSDIVLASSLKIHGYDLVKIERVGNKGTFIFAGVPDSFLNDYDLGNLRVEPIEFNNAIKSLTTAARRNIA